MEVLQAIRERRSINFFETGSDLSDEKIGELLDVGQLAPS
jgi:nitroreductase